MKNQRVCGAGGSAAFPPATLFPEFGHDPSSEPAPAKPKNSAATPRARILHAEDDDELRAFCRNVLGAAGYSVASVENGDQAWEALQEHPFDLLITDNNMPRCTGYELLLRLRKSRNDLPVIMTTSCVERFQGAESQWLNLAALLDKPFTRQDIQHAVAEALAAEHHVAH